MQKRIFLFSCLLFISSFFRAQVIIKNFTAQAANPYQALISWTIGAASQTCAQLEIQRSLDSFMNYQSIYTYPGVCGATGFDQTFTYTDPYPDIHKKNYYRIWTANSGYSNIIFVDFGAINGDYNIYPDPLSDNSVLTFDNPNNDNYTLQISNAKGNMNYTLYNNYSSQIQLPKSWFPQGIYFFRLYNQNGKRTRGKFVVID